MQLLARCPIPRPTQNFLSYQRNRIHVARRTFDRIIDGTKTVFVRFDKEYSYGDEHDAWKELAKKVGGRVIR